MAKKAAAAKSRGQQHAQQVGQVLKKVALSLSRDGWNPNGAQSIAGVTSRVCRESWPNDESARLQIQAFTWKELRARLSRRFAHESIEAWEQDMYRQPEEVVALVGIGSWPWKILGQLSPEETSIEAFMALQRFNAKGEMNAEEMAEIAVGAYPKEWIPKPADLLALAKGVEEHV